MTDSRHHGSVRPVPVDWAIIVHGGAHEISSGKEESSRAGVQAALQAGCQILQNGGTAVEAVAAALKVLEDDPTFNAGYGSALNSDGAVEMDSALMDGGTLDIGAVAGLSGVRHPSQVARSLLSEDEILLVGDGAYRYAAESGAELCRPEDLISPEQRQVAEQSQAEGQSQVTEQSQVEGQLLAQTSGGHDTVGCVALDVKGHLAAGTSTGGLDGQRAGRVGDSPLAGCGFYADNQMGAVALTGEGESLARMMTAARVLYQLPQRTPDDALQQVLKEMGVRVGGTAGGIVLTPGGEVGWWHSSPDMPVAYADSSSDHIMIYTQKNEEKLEQDR
ncbi:isoaspartyl peptidase/L-asparaginase family protein [Deinococcus oregonensis]|uniref:Isoaspartyl peptidase/L-asparaginase family protein n=1 Tax=Deinococcus oregonensis TaxID=1805970 RepID=A0ABV6AUX4_9DEIO